MMCGAPYHQIPAVTMRISSSTVSSARTKPTVIEASAQASSRQVIGSRAQVWSRRIIGRPSAGSRPDGTA